VLKSVACMVNGLAIPCISSLFNLSLIYLQRCISIKCWIYKQLAVAVQDGWCLLGCLTIYCSLSCKQLLWFVINATVFSCNWLDWRRRVKRGEPGECREFHGISLPPQIHFVAHFKRVRRDGDYWQLTVGRFMAKQHYSGRWAVILFCTNSFRKVFCWFVSELVEASSL